jgi:hypothetical protein
MLGKIKVEGGKIGYEVSVKQSVLRNRNRNLLTDLSGTGTLIKHGSGTVIKWNHKSLLSQNRNRNLSKVGDVTVKNIYGSAPIQTITNVGLQSYIQQQIRKFKHDRLLLGSNLGPAPVVGGGVGGWGGGGFTLLSNYCTYDEETSEPYNPKSNV